jgi:hypothetical protein
VGGQIENTLNSSCSPTKSWPWSRGSFRGCIGSLPPGSGQPLLLSPQKDPCLPKAIPATGAAVLGSGALGQ